MKAIRIQIIFGLTILSVLLAPAALAGKVYKWVDRDGNVQYSAQKPSDNAQELNIHTKPASDDAVDEEDSDSKEAKKGEKASKDEDPEKVKVSDKKQADEIEKKNAEIRKKNCSISQKRLATIKAGGRLFEVNGKGEHEYWDEATTASKLAEAQANVDQWCSEPAE